jgi:hypothetical protein
MEKLRLNTGNSLKRTTIVIAVLIFTIGVSSINIQRVLAGRPPPPPYHYSGSVTACCATFDYDIYARANSYITCQGTLYTRYHAGGVEWSASFKVFEKHWILWWWYWALSDDWAVIVGNPGPSPWNVLAFDDGQELPFYIHLHDRHTTQLVEYKLRTTAKVITSWNDIYYWHEYYISL